MSTHSARIEWRRDGARFTDNRYSRVHDWSFDGGARIAASSSPHVVRTPFSDPTLVDPEEAFVASLASCHMLWFLSLAAERGWTVDDYSDDALGHMGTAANGREMVAEVVLRPRVRFAGVAPPPDEFHAAHAEAHDRCFLANSVKSRITHEPVIEGDTDHA
ncbi:OsmC family protein [Solilutibacter silvestris]|uniref:OsmC family protein n=1 Tax=Solilutibacter silvestris TaxID=1645665 RepID=UPI003D34E6FB